MIVLAGATGLVGRALAELLPAGRRPWVELSRLPRDPGWESGPRRVVALDVCERAALLEALPEASAIVHVAGVAPGSRPRRADHEVAAMEALVGLGRARGVERFVFLSASGADPGASHPWLRAKGEAEQRLRASGLPHVILRASLVSAPDAPLFAALAQLVRGDVPMRLPLLCAGRVQPIAAGDAAIALATALDDHRALGRTIEIGRGPPRTLEELCDAIARRLGRTASLTRLPLRGEAIDVALAAAGGAALADAASLVRLFALLEAQPLADYERLLPMQRAALDDELRGYPWGAPPPRPGDPLPTLSQEQPTGLPLFIPGEALRERTGRATLPPEWLGHVDATGRGDAGDERSPNDRRSGEAPDPPVPGV